MVDYIYIVFSLGQWVTRPKDDDRKPNQLSTKLIKNKNSHNSNQELVPQKSKLNGCLPFSVFLCKCTCS